MQQALDFSTEKYEIIYDAIADELAGKGWCIVPDYFETDLIVALKHDLTVYQASDALSRAGIGRGDKFMIDDNVRGDKTHWLTRETEAQAKYLAIMENLRIAMNRRLFLGLFEFESHFALYEPGTFYQKHKDSFTGAANRILTTVTYLNTNWRNQDGGFLLIYHPEDGNVQARIKPEAGTLVIFLSEDIPHEVEPTQRLRSSIAGWFRCNTSLAGEINPID
ncbi:MAG: 2OG-Fe(II) oxygenase [Gammaproteobacteria bacterium]